jgi:hypothetical protein
MEHAHHQTPSPNTPIADDELDEEAPQSLPILHAAIIEDNGKPEADGENNSSCEMIKQIISTNTQTTHKNENKKNRKANFKGSHCEDISTNKLAGCIECSSEDLSKKYKCPKCRSPYCSLACYKLHKDSCSQVVMKEKEVCGPKVGNVEEVAAPNKRQKTHRLNSDTIDQVVV